MPRGMLASLRVRVELLRGMSDTFPSWLTKRPLGHRVCRLPAFAQIVTRPTPDVCLMCREVEFQRGVDACRQFARLIRQNCLQLTECNRCCCEHCCRACSAYSAEHLCRQVRPFVVSGAANEVRAAQAARLPGHDKRADDAFAIANADLKVRNAVVDEIAHQLRICNKVVGENDEIDPPLCDVVADRVARPAHSDSVATQAVVQRVGQRTPTVYPNRSDNRCSRLGLVEQADVVELGEDCRHVGRRDAVLARAPHELRSGHRAVQGAKQRGEGRRGDTVGRGQQQRGLGIPAELHARPTLQDCQSRIEYKVAAAV
ncbi:hypothetical protein [Antrihabitans stalagmiti]|uniref:hypothetical protein n=1 Tax=Antrihabitans stalagmiti TaxID=2799499 RepID=UPI0035562492